MIALVGKIFDGEKVIEKGTVIIEGDRISKVVEGEEIPPKAEVIRGFIMPGMVDAHLHFFGVEEDNVLSWNLVLKIWRSC